MTNVPESRNSSFVSHANPVLQDVPLQLSLDVARLPAPFKKEYFALALEKNTEIHGLSLLHLARRLHQAGQIEAGLGVLKTLSSSDISDELKKRAAEEWAGWTGEGSSPLKQEYVLQSFVKHSLDYRNIVPMLGASALGGLCRAGLMGALGRSARLAHLADGRWARGLAGLASLAPESALFAWAGRALHGSDSAGFGMHWMRSALDLGSFKICNFLGDRALVKVASSKIAPIAIPQAASYFALLSADRLATACQLKMPGEGAAGLADLFGSMLSMQIGARLGGQAIRALIAPSEKQARPRVTIQERASFLKPGLAALGVGLALSLTADPAMAAVRGSSEFLQHHTDLAWGLSAATGFALGMVRSRKRSRGEARPELSLERLEQWIDQPKQAKRMFRQFSPEARLEFFRCLSPLLEDLHSEKFKKAWGLLCLLDSELLPDERLEFALNFEAHLYRIEDEEQMAKNEYVTSLLIELMVRMKPADRLKLVRRVESRLDSLDSKDGFLAIVALKEIVPKLEPQFWQERLESAEALLQHQRPGMRCAALIYFADLFKLLDAGHRLAKSNYLARALADPNPHVRDCAWLALRQIYPYLRRGERSAFFANIASHVPPPSPHPDLDSEKKFFSEPPARKDVDWLSMHAMEQLSRGIDAKGWANLAHRLVTHDNSLEFFSFALEGLKKGDAASRPAIARLLAETIFPKFIRQPVFFDRLGILYASSDFEVREQVVWILNQVLDSNAVIERSHSQILALKTVLMNRTLWSEEKDRFEGIHRLLGTIDSRFNPGFRSN